MGNKLCKKKTQDVADNNTKSPPSQFDRIINRLHIRPNSWKSDTQLNQKQVKRTEKIPNEKQNNVISIKPLSKSSDWTEVNLEVPDAEDHVHHQNPKLNLIFNNDKGTPTPPPRKHKKNLREKIEAVAKTGLQAFQSKKPVENNIPKQLVEVEEPACIKKIINYKCPLCDSDEVNHNRNHHHDHQHVNNDKNGKNDKVNSRIRSDNLKRIKNLSVTSLPNYDELKLTVADFNTTEEPTSVKSDERTRPSEISLPVDYKKSSSVSTGKLDSYITRCRSFGSIFPQQLKKLRPRKAPTDIESDDSFGGLEDWDLGLIEHYNPKDASLPRPRKHPQSDDVMLADIESMILTEEEIEQEKPKPKPRRAESSVKKSNRKASDEACKRSTNIVKDADYVALHYSPPVTRKPFSASEETCKRSNDIVKDTDNAVEPVIRKPFSKLSTEENGKVEHSSLMKILEKFSLEDKRSKSRNDDENNVTKIISSNESSLTPSLVDFERSLLNTVEECKKSESVTKVTVDKNVNSDKKIDNTAVIT